MEFTMFGDIAPLGDWKAMSKEEQEEYMAYILKKYGKSAKEALVLSYKNLLFEEAHA